MALVYSSQDILELLDQLLEERQGAWWDGFFLDRDKPCPFFVDWPDESLMEYFESGSLRPGRVLELGCGHGRNAMYFARQGCEVDAVDFSETALAWARERAEKAGLELNFIHASVFDLDFPDAQFDIIYDCGCFHHLPPHRRQTYVERISNLLKPDGRFGLVCFAPEGGSGLTDLQVYAERRLGGGLGYSEADLRQIFFHRFDILSIRRVKQMEEDCHLFGKDFLFTSLMRPLSSINSE